MADRHTLRTDTIAATIDAQGAELVSLQATGGREMIWQAGPEWPRHAPILFPIVGRLAGDTLRVGGRSYPMGQHGFARDSLFGWGERAPTHCRLVLRDSDATRAVYPYGFRLEVAYAVSHSTVLVTLHVTNSGEVVLPASIGAHPAFAWPLAPDVDKAAHTLVFAAEEPAPVRRIDRGLLRAEPATSPIRGRTLHLDPALFADDAIVLDHPVSHTVTYSAPGAAGLSMSWSALPWLGLWSRPRADFLCIEPWAGHASPVGFDGDIMEKPGMMHIPPHGSRIATFCMTLK